ncbi:hypothetical protein [Nonomuraea sp. NPDC049607]|uniref:hypothetical protein n=1 Tax=unclassified Nonomuraea TaxID=2593643 RepID=UPI003423973F
MKRARSTSAGALAQEVAAFGVKVTLIEPGSYATEGAAGAVHADPDPLYDDTPSGRLTSAGKRQAAQPVELDVRRPPLTASA